MKPKWIKTIRDLIYWHYSKLICEAKGYNRSDFPLVMNIFKKLKSGEISISSLYRENVKLLRQEKVCAYCASDDKIELDHIIPKSRKGPDNVDNIIYACKKCNISKSDKDLIEWYGTDYIQKIPRDVFLKYLKLIKVQFEFEVLIDFEIPDDFESFELSVIFSNPDRFR